MIRDTSVKLTPAGKAKLDEELDQLINIKRPELSARILEANEHGDISDNGEYEGLKEELVLTDARIQELTFMLEHAEIVEQHDKSVIGFGSTVKIRGDDGVEESWTLVSHAEADTRSGMISTDSPVGQALIGKRAGDSISVSTPGGDITYTVLAIS
jgi:transcription elongation factor GreA